MFKETPSPFCPIGRRRIGKPLTITPPSNNSFQHMPSSCACFHGIGSRFTEIITVHALDLLKYGAFTVTATYSIANQLGFFKAYSLDVIYEQVSNSTYAYAEILNGGYDILTGTIDNSVNLRLNSNENVTVLGQLDQGPDLVLTSVPNITSINQLRGKLLIVNSLVNGYTYLLRKVLNAYKFTEGVDYFFQTISSTNLRYADLIIKALLNRIIVYAIILLYLFTAKGESLPSSQSLNIFA
ncbi:hypothetical protein F5884DRAFT_863167 [Xylogone sp. PMI_703]|nr:hypothetical protein F5884DRAFT_863167 [Xylogone sp. PMI_703]